MPLSPRSATCAACVAWRRQRNNRLGLISCRRATADTFRARLAGQDLSALQSKFDEGLSVETGDLVPAADLLARPMSLAVVGPFDAAAFGAG